jgi:hypothetical protein
LVDQSVTPVIINKKSGFEKLGCIHITSDDVLPQSQTCFGGSDGTGFAKMGGTLYFFN